MSKRFSVSAATLLPIMKVTNSSTLEEALERAIVTAKVSDGRADLASKNMVNLVLELCQAMGFSSTKSQLLLCLKLLRNLCAGELRNQNSFLEHNGIAAVSSIISCSEFVLDVEIIRMCLQLLGNVALAGREHQCAVWREFFPRKFSKIAELCSWEVCDPLCMVLYTCACGGADDLTAELCSDQGLPLLVEIVRTVSKAGFREEWIKLLLSRVCLDAVFFESLFSTLYEPSKVENFVMEQAFLLGILSEILNNQTDDIVVSNEFTLFILKLLRRAIQTVDFDTRGTSSLPTGIAVTNIVGYCLTILRDVCASAVSNDVVRVLVSTGIIELLLSLLNDLEPPSILRRAVKHDDTKKKCPYKGFRRDIVSILGNCSYKRKYVQDEIRERNGLLVVLQQCVADDNNPFLREWGMWSVRNILEGNEENQKLVADLKIQGTVVDVPEFASLGLKVDIDPDTNRPKLVNV